MTNPLQNTLLQSLRRDAHRGQVDAHFALGKYYADHVSNPEKDVYHHKLALKWLLKAAAQEYAEAQYKLGVIYAWGPSVLRDADVALMWLRRAADQGNHNALLEIGEVLHFYKHDGAGAMRCFEQAIAMGNTGGYYSLGMSYEMGYGTKKDKDKALELYREAARHDHVPALIRLGAWLTGGDHAWSPPDTLAEGLAWLVRAAELGDATGQYALGRFYDRGCKTHRDYKHAAELYRLAAEQGDGQAQLLLGCMYREGRGVSQDFALALEWFHKAAGQKTNLYNVSTAWAQSYLGEMYLTGQGVAVDYATAFQYFTKAGKWCSNALLNLGIMYYEGKGVLKDYPQAKKYFLKSNHSAAVSWLARMKGVRVRATRKPATTAGGQHTVDKDQAQLFPQGL